jgi:uncharacterized membrane protein
MKTSPSRWSNLLVVMSALLVLGAWLAFTQAGWRGKADAVGYAICHRIPERSFMAFGQPLPLCARCTGIYLGVMTALGVFIASGRRRVGRYPPWQVNVILGLFVVVMGVDGVNSYFHLFPGFEGPYAPTNALRVSTGIFTGLALTVLVFPTFNQSLWEDLGDNAPPIRNLRELAGLCGLLLVVLAGVAAQNATLLLFFGLVSVLGVLAILTMIMSVIFVTVTGRFRAYHDWGGLGLPLLAGLTLAIAAIGAINFLRYQLTGTWQGFVF